MCVCVTYLLTYCPPPLLTSSINSPDLHQSQQRAPAKVEWTYAPVLFHSDAPGNIPCHVTSHWCAQSTAVKRDSSSDPHACPRNAFSSNSLRQATFSSTEQNVGRSSTPANSWFPMFTYPPASTAGLSVAATSDPDRTVSRRSRVA